jgi:hypothetical protein
MAIVYVREIPHRRRSSINDGRLTHTRAWLVKTDDPADGPNAALYAVDPNDGDERIPRANVDTFPGASTITCTSVEAETKDDHPCLFEVSATYEGENAVDDVTANPLDEPAQVGYAFDQGTEPYFIDRSDTPKVVTNSAGDRFDEQSERECHTMVINVVRNEATYSPIEADRFSNTTNRDPIVIDGTTYAAGTLKLSPIAGTRQVKQIEVGSLKQELVYFQVTRCADRGRVPHGRFRGHSDARAIDRQQVGPGRRGRPVHESRGHVLQPNDGEIRNGRHELPRDRVRLRQPRPPGSREGAGRDVDAHGLRRARARGQQLGRHE